MISIEFNNMIL